MVLDLVGENIDIDRLHLVEQYSRPVAPGTLSLGNEIWY